MKRLAQFRTDMILLVLSNTLWPLGYSAYIGFFPLYIEQLGGSKLTISIISSIPFFMGLLAVVGGYLADRMDRKLILLFGWAITIPAPLIWFFADNWYLLLAGQVIYALTAVCIPAFTLYVFEYDIPGNKMIPYSIANVGGIAGSILAPSLGAKIIALYDIKILFLTVFFIYFLSTLCVLFVSGQKPQKTEKPDKGFNIVNTVKEIRGNKTLSVMIYLSLLLFCMNISEPYISLYLSDYLTMPVNMIGRTFTFIFLGASLLTYIYGKFSAKTNPHHVVLTGVVIFLLSLVTVTCFSSIYAIYAGFFCRGINRALLFFVQGVLVTKLNTKNKGLVLSLFVSMRNIAVGLAAYPGAFLYNITPVAPFIAEGLLMVLWVLISFSHQFAGFKDKPEL